MNGAGRTDAGVHARGQVASFSTASVLPVDAIAPVTQRHLPADVRVDDVREVDANFDARRSATGRHYRYLLLDAADVLSDRYAWWPRMACDPEVLAQATAVLEGEHDFSSFRSAGSTQAQPRCRVSRATWSRWERGACFDIVADHFLYRMVRNIVGSAVGLSRDPDPAGALRHMLAAGDRRAAGNAAPPQGLSLERVFYEECGA